MWCRALSAVAVASENCLALFPSPTHLIKHPRPPTNFPQPLRPVCCFPFSLFCFPRHLSRYLSLNYVFWARYIFFISGFNIWSYITCKLEFISGYFHNLRMCIIIFSKLYRHISFFYPFWDKHLILLSKFLYFYS